MNVLIEATESLTSTYLSKSVIEVGHEVIRFDISKENHDITLCDKFILMPLIQDAHL